LCLKWQDSGRERRVERLVKKVQEVRMKHVHQEDRRG